MPIEERSLFCPECDRQADVPAPQCLHERHVRFRAECARIGEHDRPSARKLRLDFQGHRRIERGKNHRRQRLARIRGQ